MVKRGRGRPPGTAKLNRIREAEVRAATATMVQAVIAAGGNVSEAARALGVSTQAFHVRVRTLGLDLDRIRSLIPKVAG